MKENPLDHPSAQRTGRVLVLGTDQRVILAVVRSLGRHGLKVDLGWTSPNSIAARSRYVTQVHDIPAYAPNDNRWKQALLDVLHQHNFDLVIPCNDSTLVPLMAHHADFAALTNIYLLPQEVFSVVSDKFETYQLAVAQGVSVPRGRIVDGSADSDGLIQELGLPLVIKPQATVTMQDCGVANVVRKVHSREDLEATLKRPDFGQALVQENFVGRGVGVELLVHQGEILFAFQHARIHETVEWGSSYRESVEVMPHLLDAARKLMQALGYTGVAMAEFILDRNSGQWVFLEINGRFWGSLPLAVAAGADFPWYLYQMLVEGKRQFETNYRKHVRCRNLPLDIGWMKKHYLQAGWQNVLAPLKIAGQLGSIVLHQDHLDSFSLDDPLPQLAELREFADKAWNRLVNHSETQTIV